MSAVQQFDINNPAEENLLLNQNHPGSSISQTSASPESLTVTYNKPQQKADKLKTAKSQTQDISVASDQESSSAGSHEKSVNLLAMEP